MIDKDALLEKLNEYRCEANNHAQYIHDHGYEDEFYYHKGYADGVDDMVILMEKFLNA